MAGAGSKLLKAIFGKLRIFAIALPLLITGCVGGVDYGKIEHRDYVADPRCDPPEMAAANQDGLPFFLATSRLPNCLDPEITMLNHRGDKLRYGRFAGPQVRPGGDKEDRYIPFSLTNEQQWWRDLAAQMQAHDGRVLVYVHGYRETFFSSSKDTAQIARLTGFDGPVIEYSWPSQGEFLKYPVDETNMNWDERNFREFLIRLAHDPRSRNITIVGHSLGARLVVPAIEYVDQMMSSAKAALIANIILSSPDLDRQIFERDAATGILSPAHVANGRHVTVYVSLADDALRIASRLHGYPRLGYPECFDSFKAERLRAKGQLVRCYAAYPEYAESPSRTALTIVDSTAVSQGRSGHSDYLRSASNCRDFAATVNGTPPPAARQATPLPYVYILPAHAKDDQPDHLAICRRSP